MYKKILMLMLLGMFLVSFVSAVDWDNSLTYSKEDKMVLIENLFGLPIIGTELATIEITSHEDLDKPIYVRNGWQEVMRIEVSSEQDYEEAIKEIEFRNLRTGKLIEPSYYWEKAVGFTEEDIPNDKEKVCGEDFYTLSNDSYYENCWWESVGTHKENVVSKWESFETKNFEKENTIIRLMVYVTPDSYIDVIPTLFGKKIKQWATYSNIVEDAHEESFNTGQDRAFKVGMQIFTHFDTATKFIINFTVNSSNNATRGYLFSDNGSSYGVSLANASIIDETVILEYELDNATMYWLLVDDDGNTFGNTRVDGTTVPWNGTNIDLSAGWDGVYRGPPSTNFFAIKSVTTADSLDPTPDVTIVYPTAIGYSLEQTIMNYTVTSDGTLQNCWYSLNLGEVNSTPVNFGINFTGLTSSEGSNTWTTYCNATTGELGNTTVTFTIDTTDPIVNITSPLDSSTTLTDYVIVNIAGVEINWTVSDTNLQTCILFNGTANETVTCGDNVLGTNLTFGTYDFTLWANDSIGNSAYSTITSSYNYSILRLSEVYNSDVAEGDSESFEINLSINPGRTITTAYLIYNGTNKGTGTVTSIAGSNYSISKSIAIPQVTSNINVSFFWNITLDNGVNANTSSNQQSIINAGFGNCSDYSNQIFNFTLRDEEEQTVIDNENTTIDVFLIVSETILETQISNISIRYSNLTEALVCVSNNTINTSSYRMDVIVRYDGDTHDIEYYNIQNATLNSSFSEEIILFDILSTSSEEFLITFKDESFSLVEGALIDITRLYVDEGVFKTIEIPKTDSNGQTVSHLVENDVVYTFIIKKEGKILATINDVIAVCQDQTIGNCEINLQALVTETEIFGWETYTGVDLSISFDEENRRVSTSFTTNDGTVSTMQMNVTEYTRFFNGTICFSSISSSSGTLICDIPISYGNTTVITEIYKDGVLIKTSYSTISRNPSELFGATGILLVALLFLTLTFLLIDSKELMMLGGILGLMIGGLLNFYNSGGLLGVGATFIWLIVGSGIIIWRISRE